MRGLRDAAVEIWQTRWMLALAHNCALLALAILVLGVAKAWS